MAHSVPQPLAPPAPPAHTRQIGKAEVNYDEKRDLMTAKIYVYVLGTSSEVPERKKEVVTMQMGYTVPGRMPVRPNDVYLRLVSYSPNIPKYTKQHDFTIVVDDTVLLREPGLDLYANMEPRPTASESYGLSKIGFSEFERIAKAKSLSIQLGTTKIDIPKDAIKAIQDLYRTVEN